MISYTQARASFSLGPASANFAASRSGSDISSHGCSHQSLMLSSPPSGALSRASSAAIADFVLSLHPRSEERRVGKESDVHCYRRVLFINVYLTFYYET